MRRDEDVICTVCRNNYVACGGMCVGCYSLHFQAHEAVKAVLGDHRWSKAQVAAAEGRMRGFLRRERR